MSEAESVKDAERSHPPAKSIPGAADQAAALRAVAQDLTGSATTGEILTRITERAFQYTRAHGAYVERFTYAREQVEIAAAAGAGVPPVATMVSYPGSLTEEIIAGRKPVLLTDLGAIGEAAAPYLADSCAHCSGLVVPLISNGEALGTLVLLRGPHQTHFGESEVELARSLGDLASVALRRANLTEAAVRARDEAMSAVAHDLKNPLHTIEMAAGTVTELLGDGAPEFVTKQLAIIHRSVRSATRLITDLLDAARLKAGRLPMDMEAVPAGVLIRETAELHTPLAEEGGQKLEISVDGDLPAVQADRDRLLQVFANLIGNAVKFTAEGGRITLGARLDGAAVEFRVEDTGRGIPPEDLEHVFDRFWQAGRSDDRGSGLGLAIARGIVEAHGGRIWAESEVGRGSTFRFLLPVGGPASAEA